MQSLTTTFSEIKVKKLARQNSMKNGAESRFIQQKWKTNLQTEEKCRIKSEIAVLTA